MSGDLEWILFEFGSDEALRDRSRFVNLMAEIAKQSDFRFRPSLTHTYPATSIEEDSIDALTNAWDTAYEKGRHGAMISCVRPNDFSVGFGVDFENHTRLYVTTDNGYISGLEPVHYENVESLAWICETVYVTMHPEYGYGMVSPAKPSIRGKRSLAKRRSGLGGVRLQLLWPEVGSCPWAR